MPSKKLTLRFPDGAPPWARWGRRVCIGGRYYRVGRANDQEAVLWAESIGHNREPEPRDDVSARETMA